jgi:hypothetical protein
MTRLVVVVKVNLTTSVMQVLQDVPFIMSLITAALSHRKFVCAGIPRDSYRSEVHFKRDTLNRLNIE